METTYQENTPGRLNDYVRVWRPRGSSTESAGYVRYLEMPSVSNQDLQVEVWKPHGSSSVVAGSVPFFSYQGLAPTPHYCVEMFKKNARAILPVRH
jgi:hypothetical protein